MQFRINGLILLIGISLSAGYIRSQEKSDSASCVKACSTGCCCSSDPTPAGVMISHVHKKKEWMVSYRYMNMEMNGILSGTTKWDPNDVYVDYLMSPDKMQMEMHMLMGMYGITDRLTIMAMFNYTYSTMRMSMLPMGGMPGMDMGPTGGSQSMTTQGLGDVKLNLMYGLINKENHQFLVSAGVNLPFGSIQQKGKNTDMYPNQRYPYAMQLGSGSLDFLPCVNYLFQKNDLTFSAQASSVIRTMYNQAGYRWGNEATFNAWLAYRWLGNLSSSIRIENSITGKINGYDPTLYRYDELSSNPSNYGGKRTSLYFGSVYQFKKGILKNNRLGFEYGVPVYQNLNGMQMKTVNSFYASWSITF